MAVLLFMGGVLLVTFVQTDASACTGKTDGTHRDPYSCKRYYECYHGSSYVHWCENGLLFNPLKHYCDWKRNVNCNALPKAKRRTKHTRPTDPAFCAHKRNGRYADPYDCTRYYSCRAHYTYHSHCPKNMRFNHHARRCVRKSYAQCVQKNTAQKTHHEWEKGRGKFVHRKTKDTNRSRPLHKIVQNEQNIHHTTSQQGSAYRKASRQGWARKTRSKALANLIRLGKALQHRKDASTRGSTQKGTDQRHWSTMKSSKQQETDKDKRNEVTMRSSTQQETDQRNGAAMRSSTQQGTTIQRSTQQGIDQKRGATLHTTKKSEEPRKLSGPNEKKEKTPKCKRIVCYFTNWARYRPKNGSMYPEDIPDGLCTHIMYAFAKLNHTGMLEATDVIDEPQYNDTGGFRRIMKLKDRDPSLKISLAVGGWTMGSSPFHQMVRTQCMRDQFITSTISFLRDRRFDGIDIDWEYPANRGSPKEDKRNYALLLQELRRGFVKEAQKTGKPRLLMTAAVGAGKQTIDTAYDVPVMNSELDFINLMGYDFHGSWDAKTGHCSPLYAGSWERNSHAYLNINWTAEYWVQKGVSRDKLVIGMPLYGRSFHLQNPQHTGVGTDVAGPGDPGPYTRSAGFVSYYEVCSMIKEGADTEFIVEQGVPFLVYKKQWIGYDDELSLREKVRYALKNGFGGVMTWSLGLDDFKGLFCNRGPYPLMTAINNECQKG